jgi:D-alanyl-D-alanine dipeptidase
MIGGKRVRLLVGMVLWLAVPVAAAAQSWAEPWPVIAPDSVARAMLVDVRAVDTTIQVAARYGTPQNFTGASLPGYEANQIYLRREAAEALARVQRRLMTGGMGLKVYDGYRPVRATLAMVEWAKRTDNTSLLTGGFVSSKSRHNLGLAVDLTLLDWSVGGREVDMGTPWDSFTDQAHWANATGRTMKYRELLRKVMESEGFKQYDQEWWHYSYDVEGETPAFDMVVGR